MSLPAGPTAQAPAQAAVRWRISAAIIDNILVYGLYLLLCLLLHWQVANLEHLLAVVVMGVVYHFALESRGGQTIGKRQYGLRVISMDGGPASAKSVAVRSALRIIDQFPVWYLSGLISMLRTGPERRQRIGDVAAGTKVIAIEGRSVTRGTPRWLLPGATLIAFATSLLFVIAVARAGHQPLTSAQAAQWVSGCDQSGEQVLDCQCALNRLEADGYNTVDGLDALFQQAQAERLSGREGRAREELAAVGISCRR